jgi:hypothetical protein
MYKSSYGRTLVTDEEGDAIETIAIRIEDNVVEHVDADANQNSDRNVTKLI